MKTCRFVVALVFLAIALAAEMSTVEPKDLSAQLQAKGRKPAVFQVGPNVLYRSKHIPGSAYAGPAGKPEGLEVLRHAVEKLPRDGELVIYCGCCPWDRCPNIKPAIELLQQMGFKRVKAMYSATNFKTDWIDQGYPVEQ